MGASLELLAVALAALTGAASAVLFLHWLTRDQAARADTAAHPEYGVEPAAAIFVFCGRDLLDMSDSSGFFDHHLSRSHHDDWESVARRLTLRFARFPQSPEELEQGTTEFFPIDSRDPGKLTILRTDDSVRLTLHGDPREGLSGSALHRMQNALIELRLMRKSLSHTPNPIFASAHDGSILWANAAYMTLAGELGYEPGKTRGAVPKLFEPLAAEKGGYSLRRDFLTEPGGDVKRWYDICAVDAGPRAITFAMNVDTVVKAEITQRNFVQTLTKTFAHLSSGLAIFNRDRQLALFNPALVDLTELPVDFLSGRPTIRCFFDMMREKQMMPEPKNYASWRERIGTLVAAATDGNFHETWSLPSGQTYRVTGRPHPDGAVAFLFEDISHEVSMTRSFRSELALGNAVLDQMDAAMAVFTADGVLAFSNAEFRRVWGFDPDSAFADTLITDALAIWRGKSAAHAPWAQVETALMAAIRLDGAVIDLADGSRRICKVRPLINGARMVAFARDTQMAESGAA